MQVLKTEELAEKVYKLRANGALTDQQVFDLLIETHNAAVEEALKACALVSDQLKGVVLLGKGASHHAVMLCHSQINKLKVT